MNQYLTPFLSDHDRLRLGVETLKRCLQISISQPNLHPKSTFFFRFPVPPWLQLS